MDLSIDILDKVRLYVKYKGKINIENADEINQIIKEKLENIKELVFDFSDVAYISSAGLRMLIDIYKALRAQDGYMYIKSPNQEVKNVFDISGFQSFLNIV